MNIVNEAGISGPGAVDLPGTGGEEVGRVAGFVCDGHPGVVLPVAGGHYRGLDHRRRPGGVHAHRIRGDTREVRARHGGAGHVEERSRRPRIGSQYVDAGSEDVGLQNEIIKSAGAPRGEVGHGWIPTDSGYRPYWLQR